MKRRLANDPVALSFVVALFVALSGNLAFFRTILAAAPMGWAADLALVLCTGLVLVLALGLLLALVALPYVWKPVAIGVLLLAAFCAHFMDAYGVVIDRAMVRNVFETDVAEASDLATGRLLLHVLVFGALPALAVARARLAFGPWRSEALRRAAVAAVVVAVAGSATASVYRRLWLVGREHDGLRLLINPIAPVYSTWRYLKQSSPPTVVAAIGEDATRGAHSDTRPVLVVLVVGETARAQNFSLGGYARETNPGLAGLPIAYFADVTSCGTSTSTSLPCMFSGSGRARFRDDETRSRENLLDVVQRAGVAVLWRDNNSGCKNLCDRVPHQNRRQLARAELCDHESCFDEVLLEGLPAWIDGLAGDGFVVLHQQGSHGPAYYRRSPPGFKKFLPECAQAAVETCTREEIVNAYDNSILYTDFVLARLVDLLAREARRLDVAMLYVSDHGESLGEHGVYLHGLPWLIAPREQTQVPMLAWLSDGFRTSRGIERACLEKRGVEPYSHDHLFHTVLGLLDVRTQVYAPELDVLRPCRSAQ